MDPRTSYAGTADAGGAGDTGEAGRLAARALTRRRFLSLAALGGAATLLAACRPASPIAQPTVESKPVPAHATPAPAPPAPAAAGSPAAAAASPAAPAGAAASGSPVASAA